MRLAHVWVCASAEQQRTLGRLYRKAGAASVEANAGPRFENCVFKSTQTLPNGGTRSSEQTMPHHTAIVRNENGHHVHLYHQNTEGDITKSIVHETSLDLRTLQTGHYTVWSPVPLKKSAP
jgi:hypothetical protein